MILCVCAGKSDHEIRAAVAAGASSVRDVQRACGAGMDCRACCPMLQALVSEGAARRGPGAHAPAAAVLA